MIIEWHNHVYPPEEAEHPEWEGRCPMSIENVLEANAKSGVDAIVVTNAAHYMRYKSDADELAAVNRWTDYAAEIQNRYKGKVYCFATLLPCGGTAYVKEMERAIGQLGLKGVFINSSHKGHYPDDDEARPFWELAQDLDIPVMIHPPHVGFESGAWFGWLAHSGVPVPVVSKVAADVARVIAAPEFREKYITGVGFELLNLTPDQFEQLMQATRAQYGPRLKALNLRLD